jgi:hypothetical protein
MLTAAQCAAAPLWWLEQERDRLERQIKQAAKYQTVWGIEDRQARLELIEQQIWYINPPEEAVQP